MWTRSVAVVVTTVFGLILLPFIREAAWTFAVEDFFDAAFSRLGWERGQVIAAATPYLLFFGSLYLLAAICYRLGEAEKGKDPVIDIDPRLAFKNILNNKRWIKKNRETDREKLQHLVSNYLAVRLDRQFHEGLVAGKLAARGEKDLDRGTGPEDWIPKEEWHKIEIEFDPPDERFRCRAKYRGGGIEYYGIKLSSRQIANFFHVRRRELFK